MPDGQPSQQTLAQLIRAKNPGAYDDMDDTTLESKILAKFPQYSDVPRTPAQDPFAGQSWGHRKNVP